MSERAGRKRAKIVEGRGREELEGVGPLGRCELYLGKHHCQSIWHFVGYLSTRIEKCASCGKWQYVLISIAMKLKFWGNFNHNTIYLP